MEEARQRKRDNRQNLVVNLPVVLLFALIFSFVLVMASPQTLQAPVTACSAEDSESTSPGTWGSACDNTYPGMALFNDDTVYEIHIARKAGLGYYAGLKINTTNASVSDCQAIMDVQFCYKWWSETIEIKNCDVSVDADAGASYTAISTSCPGTSEPGSMTCVNVTGLESWACNDFFGAGANGALAKSEAQHTGEDTNGDYNITWDVFFFNVTYENEDIWPPTFDNLEDQTIDYNDTLAYDIDASDANGISCFSVDDMSNFTINCSGYLTNATGLLVGTYGLNITVNDTYGNSNSGLMSVTVLNESAYTVTISGRIPVNGSDFSPTSPIEIGANITTGDTIDSARASVTYPNASVYTLTLTNAADDWYSASFTAPGLLGTYNVTITANNTLGNETASEGYFNVADATEPVILYATVRKTILKVGQKTKFEMQATDDYGTDSCWADVTLPDNSHEIIVLDCGGASADTGDSSQYGTYDVMFYANDTSGNLASQASSYEVLSKVDVTYTLTVIDAVDLINITLYKEGEEEIVYTNVTEGEQTAELPDGIFDFEFRTFEDRLNVKFSSVNVSDNLDNGIGLDKHFEDDESLATYGVGNNYTFSDATVTLRYDDLEYDDEDHFEVYKCDDYDLASRSCMDSWHNISATVSQNQSGKYLTFTTSSFSGFSIREYIPQAPPPGGETGTGAEGSITSAGLNYSDYWTCDDWSGCSDSKQTRKCVKHNTAGNEIGTKVVERECLTIDATGLINITEEERRRKIFDATLIVEDVLDRDAGNVNAVVLLENFGRKAAEIDLKVSALDAGGNEVLSETKRFTVESLLWLEYDSLEALADGVYTVKMEAEYIPGEGEEEFDPKVHLTTRAYESQIEIRGGGILAASKRIVANYSIFHPVNLVGLLILAGLGLAYYYFHKKAFKRKERKEKKKEEKK